MTKFTVWEVVLDFFQLNHQRTCPHYLAQEHPTKKLVEDFANEFALCPWITHVEYGQLRNHFHKHAELVERISYSKAFCESDAVELMESFALASEFKSREVDLGSGPTNQENTGESFEIWRQDDNGNEFLVSSFSCRYEAQLLRKRFERKGHKQHYWVKAIAPVVPADPNTPPDFLHRGARPSILRFEVQEFPGQWTKNV